MEGSAMGAGVEAGVTRFTPTGRSAMGAGGVNKLTASGGGGLSRNGLSSGLGAWGRRDEHNFCDLRLLGDALALRTSF